MSSKTILITGALSDIGRAAAVAFAQRGYAVALNYRRHPEQAEALADDLIRNHGAPAAAALQADVRSRDEIVSLFERTARLFGPPDVLVNNAGVNRDRPFLEMSPEEWQDVQATILGGTFFCSQEFARRYPGDSGSIINIGAVTALKGRKNGANYCSARAGVLALTKCLAQELAPRIRVNTITPGRIDTEELRTRYHIDAESRSTFEKDIPLGRLGCPEDVASMMLFVVEAGSYITGHNLFVDGGLYMV